MQTSARVTLSAGAGAALADVLRGYAAYREDVGAHLIAPSHGGEEEDTDADIATAWRMAESEFQVRDLVLELVDRVERGGAVTLTDEERSWIDDAIDNQYGFNRAPAGLAATLRDVNIAFELPFIGNDAEPNRSKVIADRGAPALMNEWPAPGADLVDDGQRLEQAWAAPRPAGSPHPPRQQQGPVMPASNPDASRSDQRADARDFIARLNGSGSIPSWSEAAGFGIPLVDLAREEHAARQWLADLEHYNHGLDPTADPALAEATVEDLADARDRVEQVAERPGRYFLASGATIEAGDAGTPARQTGWWYDNRCTRINTPNGERIHRPGIHPDASIHTTARVHPTARVERSATIGPNAHVDAHAHIGCDTMIGAHAHIGPGTFIGAGNDIGPQVWVSQGAMIEPNCTIGHHSTIGAGSRVAHAATIEPYSRLGSGTTTSSNPAARNPRAPHVTGLVEQLMRLDRE